jgi:hypothetical protein
MTVTCIWENSIELTYDASFSSVYEVKCDLDTHEFLEGLQLGIGSGEELFLVFPLTQSCQSSLLYSVSEVIRKSEGCNHLVAGLQRFLCYLLLSIQDDLYLANLSGRLQLRCFVSAHSLLVLLHLIPL